MLFEKWFHHDKQFSSAATGLLFSDTINVFKYQPFIELVMKLLFIMFMICLIGVAQQFTQFL